MQLNPETTRVLHKQETVPYFAVDTCIIAMNSDITSTERAYSRQQDFAIQSIPIKKMVSLSWLHMPQSHFFQARIHQMPS